ncbi:hypothetical protein LY76DRAFT_166123 [Colletotrichum caudatum]|nr:hypothetical protein LY76DRAFT_166123 [Colletotrichum caudatum]
MLCKGRMLETASRRMFCKGFASWLPLFFLAPPTSRRVPADQAGPQNLVTANEGREGSLEPLWRHRLGGQSVVAVEVRQRRGRHIPGPWFPHEAFSRLAFLCTPYGCYPKSLKAAEDPIQQTLTPKRTLVL